MFLMTNLKSVYQVLFETYYLHTESITRTHTPTQDRIVFQLNDPIRRYLTLNGILDFLPSKSFLCANVKQKTKILTGDQIVTFLLKGFINYIII